MVFKSRALYKVHIIHVHAYLVAYSHEVTIRASLGSPITVF